MAKILIDVPDGEYCFYKSNNKVCKMRDHDYCILYDELLEDGGMKKRRKCRKAIKRTTKLLGGKG